MLNTIVKKGSIMLKRLITPLLLLNTITCFAYNKAICGNSDDRELSYKSAVGRILESPTATHGCTATMISKNCAISAGHCAPILNYVEFNTPLSINGELQHADEKDIYIVDKNSIILSRGSGQDFVIFKLLPNQLTQESAGTNQGFLKVNFKKVKRKAKLIMYSYGKSNDPQANYAQQLSQGNLKKIKSNGKMYHKLDSAPGSSGAALLLADSEEIIGIHNGNGCQDLYAANRATAISTQPKLQAAIKECINSDRE